jgi:hypothetical protein
VHQFVIDPEKLTPAHVALLISGAALAVSLTALFWNVFKELGLRPRVRVTVNVMAFKYDGHTVTKIVVYAVNFGPGAVYLNSVTLKPGGEIVGEAFRSTRA